MKRTVSVHAALVVLVLLCTFLVPSTQKASAHSRITFRQSTSGPQLSAPLTPQTLSTVDQKVIKIKQVTFTPDGGWLVLYGANGYSSIGLPTELADKLDELNQDSKEIRLVSFTPDGGWIIVSGKQGGIVNGYDSKDLPQSILDKLDSLNGNGFEFKDIAFAPDGEWVILYGSNRYAASKGMSSEVTDKLDSLIKDSRSLKQVAFVSDGSWIILYNDNRYAASGIPSTITDELKKLNADNWQLNHVSFMAPPKSDATPDDSSSTASAGDGWIILYGSNGVIYSEGIPEKLLDRLKDLNSGVE